MKLFHSVVLLSLLSFSCRPVQKAESDLDFAGGEHKMLGETGYQAACASSKVCPKILQRADGKESFSYGELVAFSGDFYETPEAVWLESRNQSFFHPFSNSVNRVKSFFADEEEAAKKQMSNPDISYPDHNLGMVFAFPKYLELAKNNVSHFGWHNMKHYLSYHEKAISLAVKAREEKDKAKSEKLLQQALFVNAFADHFLTDGFATGHLRNPRKQALDWQTKSGYGKTAVDSLAKLMHDHDHLLSETHGPGLAVKNARGDQWHTRCDGELFVAADANAPQTRLPVEAVKLSVEEVLAAYAQGTTPAGIYAAANLVPVPLEGEKPLIEIFHPQLPDSQIEAWLKSLGIINYFRIFIGLTPSGTRQFFAALPQIMDQFRADVKADSATIPALKLRLPPTYTEGFSTIR